MHIILDAAANVFRTTLDEKSQEDFRAKCKSYVRFNTLFHEIAVQTRVLGETKNDNPFLDCHFGSNVGMARYEHNYNLLIINVYNFAKIDSYPF